MNGCAEIREMLPAYAGANDQSLAVRRHLARCADCRSEKEMYDALSRSLAKMATTTVEPPPGLLQSLVAIPSQGARRRDAVRAHVVSHRNAYARGLAVAVVGAGAAALWRRHRLATA